MNDEVTVDRAERVRKLAYENYWSHVMGCTECRWEHAEDEDIVYQCDRADELEHFIGKWFNLSLPQTIEHVLYTLRPHLFQNNGLYEDK